MRFLKRKGNGHLPVRVVSDVKQPKKRRPWVLAPVLRLHDWCEPMKEEK